MDAGVTAAARAALREVLEQLPEGHQERAGLIRAVEVLTYEPVTDPPMTVTATMPMVHRCPYVDELDMGVVTFTWNREAPDLHDVAADVRRYADESVTHEQATQHLATSWGCPVTTEWVTAGMVVTVEATPELE